jgi:hypothetical protein
VVLAASDVAMVVVVVVLVMMVVMVVVGSGRLHGEEPTV